MKITIDVNLLCTIKREKDAEGPGYHFVATCPLLGITAGGDSKQEAQDNLDISSDGVPLVLEELSKASEGALTKINVEDEGYRREILVDTYPVDGQELENDEFMLTKSVVFRPAVQ